MQIFSISIVYNLELSFLLSTTWLKYCRYSVIHNTIKKLIFNQMVLRNGVKNTLDKNQQFKPDLRPYALKLCRGHPSSRGRIEYCIKFIKQNVFQY